MVLDPHVEHGAGMALGQVRGRVVDWEGHCAEGLAKQVHLGLCGTLCFS